MKSQPRLALMFTCIVMEGNVSHIHFSASHVFMDLIACKVLILKNKLLIDLFSHLKKRDNLQTKTTSNLIDALLATHESCMIDKDKVIDKDK